MPVFPVFPLFPLFPDLQIVLCYLQNTMNIWTRDELLTLLADWKAAYRAASTGKSYAIGTRTLTRYDLPVIREQLVYLERELAALETGQRGPRMVRAVVRR